MLPTETFRAKVPVVAAKLMGDFPIGPVDAAAMLGNLGHESNGFTDLQELAPTVKGSRGGYGWAQWTGPRRRAYEAYCKRNQLDPASDKANYAWLFLELKGSEAKAITKTISAETRDQKVYAFERSYLRAGVPHYPSRRHWAALAADAIVASSGGKPIVVGPMPEAERIEILNDGIRESDRKRDGALAGGASVATAGGIGTIGGTVAVTDKRDDAPVPGGEWMLLGLGLVFVVAAVATFLVASRHNSTAARLRAARLGG